MRFLLIALTALAIFAPTAHAFDNGQYENVDPNVRAWFKGVRSPHGVPCCDIGDGHPTQEDWRSDGSYWIPNPALYGPDGQYMGDKTTWIQVPPEAVVNNAGNPTGSAIVWYVPQGPGSIYIRCFVAGGGV